MRGLRFASDRNGRQHMFRTHTGQTGTDAYQYEAAAIVNALRELDARAAALASVMVAELPADASVSVSIASDRFPEATMDNDRDGIARVLPMLGAASSASVILDYARALADPSHIVKH